MIEELRPVTITPRALREIRHIMETKNIPRDYGLRIGVRGGGCGVTPMLGFDKKNENDLVYTVDGVDVYVDRRQTLFLIGQEIDFVEGEEGRGFAFKNPGPETI